MIGSLCSGYGGLDRAVAALFGESVGWHVENDDAAVHVLKERFPGVPNLGDVTGADWTGADRPHVIATGFPCQPFSVAGPQLGADDERYLWDVGIWPAIDALGAAYVVIENVANLAGMQQGKLWRGMLDQLNWRGYTVVWGIFGACLAEVAGCHHRHRLFALARLDGSAALPPVRWQGRRCGVPARRASGATSPVARDGDRSGRGEGSAEYWARKATTRTNGAPLPAVLSMLPTPQGRDGADGRGQPTAERAQARMDAGRRNLDDALALLPTPSAVSYGSNRGGAAGRVGPVRHSLESLARLEMLPTPSAVQPQNFGRYAAAVERWSAVHGSPPEPTSIGPNGGVRMAQVFPEWMMGLRRGYVTDLVDRLDALRLIGNGVFPLQAYHALTTLRTLLPG